MNFASSPARQGGFLNLGLVALQRLGWAAAGLAILAGLWLIAGHMISSNPKTATYSTFGLIPTLQAFPEMWSAGKIQSASIASG